MDAASALVLNFGKEDEAVYQRSRLQPMAAVAEHLFLGNVVHRHRYAEHRSERYQVGPDVSVGGGAGHFHRLVFERFPYAAPAAVYDGTYPDAREGIVREYRLVHLYSAFPFLFPENASA